MLLLSYLPAAGGVALVLTLLSATPFDTARRSAEPQTTVSKPLDVIYVPTPHSVVKAMLATAKVGPGDVAPVGCVDVDGDHTRLLDALREGELSDDQLASLGYGNIILTR